MLIMVMIKKINGFFDKFLGFYGFKNVGFIFLNCLFGCGYYYILKGLI